MSVSSKRLDRVVEALSPEAKARWLIEGPLLGHEATEGEAQRVLASLSPQEGRRYNAYISRWRRLRDNLRFLLSMCSSLHVTLLERDRLLWYRRGLMDVAEAIVFGDAAGPLLVRNLNVKPGQPLVVQAGLGRLRLGVWGRRRSPAGKEPDAELAPQLLEALDALASKARAQASECKAVAAYVRREAQWMELQGLPTLAQQAVDVVAGHDRPLLREVVGGTAKGPPAGALFPVEERWGLVWEEVEEDQETARRIGEAPEGWRPPSVDRLAERPTL